ncbi:MAG: cobyric acid synthase CobQ [Acidobacteria bacterium]|nr:MAG: cobyric acid synthase CobQ [Acidobacteriota bacterium]
MTARKIMIQGTASNVGKSVIVAALCSYFRQQGLRVAPFKSQNMSNNSFVTASGGEIGRAQAFQAQVCGIEPTVEMNPILLKPSSEMGAQVVVLGKSVSVMTPRQYHESRPQLLGVIRDALEKLSSQYEILVIEGAGSPAELNLRPFDMANMTVAKMAAAPVVLVGDINLGGVFASLLGTLELLTPEERSFVKALLINKFRGDVSQLDQGLDFLKARTGKKLLGVLPFVDDLQVAEEDSIPEWKWKSSRAAQPDKLKIQVIHYPHISNSTDFDSLEREPDVSLRFLTRVPDSEPFPDALILPGSKSTMSDLAYMRSSGFERYIVGCHQARVLIVGICGGYQILGKELLDPEGVESVIPRAEGLGLLQLQTCFAREKKTVRVRALHIENRRELAGYEIHMGRTNGPSATRPVFQILEEMGSPTERFEGARSEDGLVWGTYLHGVFDTPSFRRDFLNALRKRRGWPPREPRENASLDESPDSLAALIRKHVDLVALDQILNGML